MGIPTAPSKLPGPAPARRTHTIISELDPAQHCHWLFPAASSPQDGLKSGQVGFRGATPPQDLLRSGGARPGALQEIPARGWVDWGAACLGDCGVHRVCKKGSWC